MIDLSEMMKNLDQSLKSILIFVFGFSYVLGTTFIIRCVFRLKQYGDSRTMMSSNTSVKEPLLLLLVGAIFYYIPTGIRLLLNTTFGSDSPLSYTDLTAQGSVSSQTAISIIHLVQVIGLISFIKGWYSLSKLGAQGGGQGNTFGKSVTHIVGGLLAINIVGTMNVVTTTLGLSI